MSYRLSNEATAELSTVFNDGLARFGEDHALRYRQGLERTFDLLATHPQIARLRTELKPAIRAFPYRPFMIIYTIEDGGDVLILRIRHGREDWTSDPLNG